MMRQLVEVELVVITFQSHHTTLGFYAPMFLFLCKIECLQDPGRDGR